MNKNTPTIKTVQSGNTKQTLRSELELVLTESDDHKKGLLFESFLKNFFLDLAKLHLLQFELKEAKKQVDIEGLNNGLIEDCSVYLWIECKHTGKIGAPTCYKHAGQLWLNGKANTQFIFSLGGFADTAMQVVQQMQTKELKRLVLVNLEDINNFLGSELELKDWIKLLWLRADKCGDPGSKLPEINTTRKILK